MTFPRVLPAGFYWATKKNRMFCRFDRAKESILRSKCSAAAFSAASVAPYCPPICRAESRGATYKPEARSVRPFDKRPNAIVNRMQEPETLIHEILPVGMLQCNCHIVGDQKTREAIVIDPGDDAGRILALVEKHHLKVTAIVVTHTHIDHVVGLHRVHAATGAPVYIHGDDLDLYRHLDMQAQWLGWKIPEQVKIEQLAREGDAIRWGSHEALIVHTPGHTPGSICL